MILLYHNKTDSTIRIMVKNIIDVSALFLNGHAVSHYPYYLWIKHLPQNNEDIKDKKSKKIIKEFFEESGFLDYIPIAFAVVNFLETFHFMLDHGIVNVVVSEGSKLAKGHHAPDNSGFIELFGILVDKTNKIRVHNLNVNIHLVAKKFKLNASPIKYPNELKEYEGEEKDINCPICYSSKGDMVTTPCNHQFHLDCLKCVPKFKCPICRENIYEFLGEAGVPKAELLDRFNNEKREQKLEEHNAMLNYIYLESVSFYDFMRLSMTSLQLTNGNVNPYADIVFDMNANASQYFSKIANAKSKRGKGVFMYIFDTPIDFILYALDQKSPSSVEWIKIKEFDGTPIKDKIVEKMATITNKNEEYGVIIIIENIIDMSIIHKDDKTKRLNQEEIINTILRCHKVRFNEEKTYSCNKEYKWAKETWRDIEFRQQKYLNKKKLDNLAKGN